jgi:hypothetical protein
MGVRMLKPRRSTRLPVLRPHPWRKRGLYSCDDVLFTEDLQAPLRHDKSLVQRRSGTKFRYQLRLPDLTLEAETAALQGVPKLPGLDSNQQPSG